MIIDETIHNLQAALRTLATKDPQLAKHLELAPAVDEAARLALWEVDRYDRRWLVDGEAQQTPPAEYQPEVYPGEGPGFVIGDAVASAHDGHPTEGQVALLATADWLPPVIGSPSWFLEEVAEAYGQGRTDYLVDELCGLKVIQRDELSEPLLVMPDGKTYTIVPEWARRTAEQIASDDARRRLSSAPAGGVS